MLKRLGIVPSQGIVPSATLEYEHAFENVHEMHGCGRIVVVSYSWARVWIGMVECRHDLHGLLMFMRCLCGLKTICEALNLHTTVYDIGLARLCHPPLLATFIHVHNGPTQGHTCVFQKKALQLIEDDARADY